MYTPVAKRNTPARTGYVPVAQRKTVPLAVEQKAAEPKASRSKSYIQGVKERASGPSTVAFGVRNPKLDKTQVSVKEFLKEVPGAARDLLFPTRGYSEKQLKDAKPTVKQTLLGIPKVVAEFASSIGNAIPVSDRSLVGKLANSKYGDRLANVGGKIEDFGKPKNVEEAKAMRIFDIASSVPMGAGTLSVKSAVSIARSKSVPEILTILTKEIPKLADNEAEVIARLLVDVDNVDDVQRVLNKTGMAVQDAGRQSLDATADPLLTEARNYKSAEEFANNAGAIRDNFDWSYLDEMKARKAAGESYSHSDFNYLSKIESAKRGNESRTFYRAGSIGKDGDIWLTPQEAGATQYGSAGGTKVGEYKVATKNPLILQDVESIEKILGKKLASESNFTNSPAQKQAVIDYAKKNGYDSVLMPDSFPDGAAGMESLVVWDRNLVKTKSQLTDIWKKAQGGDVLRAEARAQGLPELPKIKAKTNPRTALIETGKKPELQFQNLDELARQMRNPEVTEQRLEGISLELARLEEVADTMPGKQLQRFKSRKEGQFLDLKDPTKAKTEAQRRALLAREEKVLKASESAFEGTQLADRYDDPDTIREAIDEYTKTKERIKELRATATEIRAERSAIRKGERLMQLTKGNRRMAYRAVRNAFDLTESDLMKIRRGRDIMAMDESEFNTFIGEAEKIAERMNRTRQARVGLESTIYEKQLRKWENVSEAMGFPQISKMTPEQLDALNEVLSQYQKGDEFLTARQLETINRTPLTGMRTIREVTDYLAKTHGLTAGELPPIKAHPWMYDTQLARQHPLYDLLVDRYNESYLRANGTVIELEREVGDLIKAARKSRPQGVGGKIAPTDSQIVQWLEADTGVRTSLEADMTGAEIKAAKRMDEVFKGYYDWLSGRALDKKFSSRFENKYFPHVRRGFLESWKEDGVLKAVKEQFDQFKQEEKLLSILDEKTGDVLPYEKWVGFSQFRSDNLVPTKNAAQAFNSYITALEKARQWDGFIPEIMVYVHSLSPRTMTKRGLELDDSVKRFVKEWINSKKGRVAKQIVKPGGKVDWALRTGVALTRIRDLGLNIPVGIANIFGEQAGNLTMLGAKKFTAGAARLASKQGRAITKKYANFVGKTFWEKLTEASNTAGDQLMSGMYGLFGAASRRANQLFLLGNLTDEEFKTGVVSIERLAELRKAMGKYRAVEGSESIFGKTAEGAVGGQYKKWAIPILVSTVDNGKRLAKIISTKGVKEALSSPEGSELFYSFLVSATIGLGTMGYYNELKDNKDRNFIEDVMYKSVRDSLSMIGAMDPQFIGSFAAPRLSAFIIDLTESISQLIRLEENKDGELKGANSLQRTLTPTLVKSLFAEEETKSSSSGGLPDLPALPKLPQLPKLPKLPSL